MKRPPFNLPIFTIIDRQICWTVSKAAALMAVGLTSMLTILDFVQQLAAVGRGTYHVTDALAVSLLSMPATLFQQAPVALLLGTVLALGHMNRTAELAAIRALGISRTRIMAASGALLLPFCAAWLLCAQLVIPTAQLLAQQTRTAALPPSPDDALWAHAPGQYLGIAGFAANGAMTNVEIYSFDPTGALTGALQADHANRLPTGPWRLQNVTQRTITADVAHTTHLPTLDWPPFLSRSELRLLRLPPADAPPVGLWRYLARLHKQHLAEARLRRALWQDLVYPLSLLCMLLAAAPFVFGPPRSVGTGAQVVGGGATGIAFALAQQIVPRAAALAGLGPALGALATPVAISLFATWLLRRRS